MPVTTVNPKTVVSTPATSGRRWKIALWAVLGAMTLSVLLYSEVRIFRQAQLRAYYSTILLILVPHIAGGCLALLSGPLQFSSRLRRRYPRFHRVLGRCYVCSVFVAAPLAIVLSNHRHDPRAKYFVAATVVQAGTWIVTTACAFVTARNRQIQQHREWMVRSYALTFTFVATRVLQPIPAWNRHSEAGFAMEIIVIVLLSILVPDIAMTWRALTTRRVSPVQPN